jgi:DNA-binding NarL/FixJ family response regulator
MKPWRDEAVAAMNEPKRAAGTPGPVSSPPDRVPSGLDLASTRPARASGEPDPVSGEPDPVSGQPDPVSGQPGRVSGEGGLGAPVRVLIVDDDALVRAGLTMILSGAVDVAVVGEAADGSEVPAAVAACRPDVVLMDIRMPRVDGLAATESLRRRPDAPEVIVLTTFDADEFVLRALRAGASGFLLKDTPPMEIRQAVRKVALGEATLSPTVTRRLIAHVAAPRLSRSDAARSEAVRLLDRLSERERDVALALGQGRSNAEISAELFMSVATVKAHVSRLLTKLDLNNRVQVALLVHDAGLA